MLSSQLLELRKILNEEQIESLEKYVDSFTMNTKLTASKFATDINIDTDLATKVLDLLTEMEILSFKFAVRCPSCGLLHKLVDNICNIDANIECYNCETESEITYDDVEVIYTVKNIPFLVGQQSRIVSQPMSVVHIDDSLAAYLEKHNYNLNSIVYNPTDSELCKLRDGYQSIFQSSTPSDKGVSLENFVLNLFNTCKHFEATSNLRLNPNQIDCYVRNKLCSPGVPGIGAIGSFCIECKNETKKPTSTYMNKMHSILRNTGLSFGIIVSKCKVPKTFTGLANSIYLNDKIVIITLDKDDLENVVMNKINILDIIEMKVNEVKLNATKPLREIGLYNDLS